MMKPFDLERAKAGDALLEALHAVLAYALEQT